MQNFESQLNKLQECKIDICIDPQGFNKCVKFIKPEGKIKATKLRQNKLIQELPHIKKQIEPPPKKKGKRKEQITE